MVCIAGKEKRLRNQEGIMIALLIFSLILGGYLVYALINPEKF